MLSKYGVRATSPARSIVNAARSFTAPEQIEMAAQQALECGIATPEEFDRIIRVTRANQYMRDILRRVIRLKWDATREPRACRPDQFSIDHPGSRR
jgi:hypothetical protein